MAFFETDCLESQMLSEFDDKVNSFVYPSTTSRKDYRLLDTQSYFVSRLHLSLLRDQDFSDRSLYI
jgi:hypothetical protein